MFHEDGKIHKNTTLNDVQLAAVYYPILVDLALHKHCLTYGELVAKAKELHPGKDYVTNAIAVSAGRKLDVVRAFTNERELPDVTSLIISKGDGECGSAFSAVFDPKEIRKTVFDFDWSEVSTEFDSYIDSAEKSTKPKKSVKRPEALKLMSGYYKDHKEQLPKSIVESRDEIVSILMEGFSPEEAFEMVQCDLA